MLGRPLPRSSQRQRIKAANGQDVATDGGQGYETKTHARNTLEKVISGHYDGPIKELD